MMAPEDTRIAFIGGAFSSAVLEAVVRLADAGYEVVAGPHDPRESVALSDAGIFCAANQFDATYGADVVITCCRQPADVEDLFLGDNGLLESLDAGTVVIDMSLIGPRLAREIQAMSAIAEITYLDAPIVNVGEQEQAICFLGGERDGIDMISPLMPFLAPTIIPLEEPGEGQLSAVISIIGLAGSIMGSIEAMSIAHISGFSNKAALNVLASTSAASRALVDYVPRMIGYNYAGRISTAEFMDALDVALDVAEDLGVTLPMVETAYQLYDLLGVVGGDNMNIQALALLYEDEQTCADYGLDWSLAENAQSMMPQNPGMPEGVPEDFRGLIERAIQESGLDLSGDMPRRRVDDDDDDMGMDAGFGMGGGPGGIGGPGFGMNGGFPSPGSFFSVN